MGIASRTMRATIVQNRAIERKQDRRLISPGLKAGLYADFGKKHP
jgi:hypothetical protein